MAQSAKTVAEHAMALHLVDRLESHQLAVRTARQLDYIWDPVAGLVVET